MRCYSPDPAQPQTAWLDFRDSKGRGQGRERKRGQKGKEREKGREEFRAVLIFRKNPDMHVLADGKTQE